MEQANHPTTTGAATTGNSTNLDLVPKCRQIDNKNEHQFYAFVLYLQSHMCTQLPHIAMKLKLICN